MELFRLIARCSVLALLSAPAIAGEASGKFTVDKQAIGPRTATAYEVRDQSDGRKRSVEIMLASSALDPAELAATLDPHVYAINSEAAKGDYILIWARPDGSAAMNATFAETMTQYLDATNGSLKVEWSENTSERVAGRLWTPKPVKSMSGESWSVDVRFAANVVRRPAGTKLPADGGDAGRALEALYGAVGRKDMTGIRAGVAPERMSSLEHDYNTPAENLKEAVETLGEFWLPKKHKVTGGEVRGEVAILEVEGELYAGSKWLFLVQMTKGPAGWQYADKVPAGQLK